MSPYGVAWVVTAGSLALGLFALYRATRGPGWTRTRLAVALLLAVWLLLPAPVPGFDGHFAPAFVVLTFEALFQQAGQPRTAGMILGAGTALAVAVMLLLAVIRRNGKARD